MCRRSHDTIGRHFTRRQLSHYYGLVAKGKAPPSCFRSDTLHPSGRLGSALGHPRPAERCTLILTWPLPLGQRLGEACLKLVPIGQHDLESYRSAHVQPRTGAVPPTRGNYFHVPWTTGKYGSMLSLGSLLRSGASFDASLTPGVRPGDHTVYTLSLTQACPEASLL
jgi:hypothetical protein